ncbi:MAG: hypothetical protein ACD_3C00101G0004 [uncultured bacterium (gcode 4)]|uniref:Tyrosine specific protein phosphatases domain-containing protein n=1 Tax=uncultured bacterium (gcode 4) TaxID=1234023 RepID=K2FYT7_9BACT|nr:MAG: hypothetical protein ACD_3C00101G0004 [uncultured bacterium (gcode 4)]
MELRILSLSESVAHTPEKPTYAIRIFNSREHLAHLFNLQKSDNYIWIDCYGFDDNEAHWRQCWPVSINEDIAKKIIENFIKYRERVDSLIVNCTRWINRSPSVAIALNDIFQLWADSDELFAKYPDYNHLVYVTLRRAWSVLWIKDWHK